MAAYYNDNDPAVCEWARELIRRGLVADGEVDCRPIQEVRAEDLRGFSQCHFFSGILGWSLALRTAGVADDFSVWTGSCPCQPLSCAGKQRGHEDERHLWPEFLRLIRECSPPIVFGEQVSSRLGLEWLVGVQADLEDAGYAFGSASLNAAGAGSPHIRQRLYWVAQSTIQGLSSEQAIWESRQAEADSVSARSAVSRLANPAGIGRGGRGDGDSTGYDGALQIEGRRDACGVADTRCNKPRTFGWEMEAEAIESSDESSHGLLGRDGDTSGMADYDNMGPQGRDRDELRECEGQCVTGTSSAYGRWERSYWHECTDGKFRRVPVEPAFFPLVDDRGKSGRVGILRGAGNAIVPEIAAIFIRAAIDSIGR